MLGKHSHGDSRLTCIDCGETICSKCMVECPVGFRCQQCAGKFKSHLIVVSPWIIARTALACLAIGFFYGMLAPKGGFSPWMGWIISYFAGAIIGKGVHKVAAYKLARSIVWTIVGALSVGVAVSPLGGHVYLYVSALLLSTGGDSDKSAILGHVVFMLGQCAVFGLGILSPIIWGFRKG